MTRQKKKLHPHVSPCRHGLLLAEYKGILNKTRETFRSTKSLHLRTLHLENKMCCIKISVVANIIRAAYYIINNRFAYYKLQIKYIIKLFMIMQENVTIIIILYLISFISNI